MKLELQVLVAGVLALLLTSSWLLVPRTVQADSSQEMWHVGRVEGTPKDGTDILEIRIYKTRTWLGVKGKGVVLMAEQGDMHSESSLTFLEFQDLLARVTDAEKRLPALPIGAHADCGTVGGVEVSVSCTGTGRRFLHLLVNGPSVDIVSDDLGDLDDLLSNTKSQLQ